MSFNFSAPLVCNPEEVWHISSDFKRSGSQNYAETHKTNKRSYGYAGFYLSSDPDTDEELECKETEIA